jgi:glycosyltransferase involved in cell wall biosynthesis
MGKIGYSVVIPLYNKAEFVGRAIDSVLGQTHRQFECIVVNDGSTDSSLEEVQRFDDGRIRVVTKDNGGVSSARNRGIAEACHRYVALLDADDYWSPGYLEDLSNVIRQFPGRGLYFSSHWMVSSAGTTILRASPEIATNEGAAVFNLYDYFALTRSYRWSLHTSCCVMDKSVALEAGGFDERMSFYEDYDLFSRIGLREDFVYLNKPLSFYSNDARPDQRLTGTRPDISKHWANYIFEGPLAHSREERVQFFLHNFAVFLLQGYRRDRKNLGRVSELRKLIRPSMLSAKALAWHYSPGIISTAYGRIKSGLRRRTGWNLDSVQ